MFSSLRYQVLAVLSLCFAAAAGNDDTPDSCAVKDAARARANGIAACRHDPTWQTLKHESCQTLMSWQPDIVGEWWRDHPLEDDFVADHQEPLTTCFHARWERYLAARPMPPQNHAEPRIVHREEEVTLVKNVLAEEELVALEKLGQCAYENLPRRWPYYQRRTDIGTGVEYTEAGAHECVYLQGLMQLLIPGVVASLAKAVRVVSQDTSVAKLGIRTAEYLLYTASNRVGWHEDSGSVQTMSLSLTNASDYSGGDFLVQSAEEGFKVDRGAAILFNSSTEHAVSPMTSGERRVLVVEYWEEQDAPVGLPRPHKVKFARWKAGEREEPILSY